MIIDKKMQNWYFVEDKVIFRNYLLNLTNKDFERVTLHDRHFIRISGVNLILKGCYQEIKRNIPNEDIVKFLKSKLNNPNPTIWCWLSGINAIPIFKFYDILKIWKEVCNKSQEEFNNKWDNIFSNVKYYSVCGSKTKAKLPREFTEDLAYVMGFILADGYVKNDDRLLGRKKYTEHSISMYDESELFLKYLQQLFFNLFEVKCNLHNAQDKKGSWYVLRCTSKPVHRFFCDVLGFTRGSKTGNIDVPSIIANAPQNFQKAFIAGFFDGDGGVGITRKNPWLELGQVSINDYPIPIIVWIKDKLKYFGIDMALSKATNKDFWRLRTGSKTEILKFYDIISSRYPLKIEKYNQVRDFSYERSNRYWS